MMNLVIANHYLNDAEMWRMALGAGTVIDIVERDKLKAFSEISIKLDEHIYLNRKPVDWVLYACEETEINWGKFMQIQSAVSKTDDTIFLASGLTGNFYCRPHVFSMLGSVYKLKVHEINLFNTTKVDDTQTRLLFSIVRSGYNLRVL